MRRHQDGDQAGRDALIEQYLPLARRLASRYRNSGEALDDLEQVASVGLIKAIDRFEPGQGSFARYAVPTISGELKRHFRDKGWGLHVPRHLQERALAVNDALESLAPELGRSPTPRDVAAFTGLNLEEVLEAMDAASAYSPMSLDTPQPGLHEEGDQGLVATIGAEDPAYEIAEWRPTVAPAIDALPEREQQILRLRFIDDLTQSEIAKRVGISQITSRACCAAPSVSWPAQPPSPPSSPRRGMLRRMRSQARRALTILREQGPVVLWWKFLGEAGYRRILLFERDVANAPRGRANPPPGIQIGLLRPDEVDAYLAFHPYGDRTEIEGRLAERDRCHVARVGTRIVACRWVSVRRARIEYLKLTFPLERSQAFVYDVVTDPAFRRRGISRAMYHAQTALLESEGVTTVLSAAVPENPDGVGFTAETSGQIATLTAVGFGRRRRRWRREAPR